MRIIATILAFSACCAAAARAQPTQAPPAIATPAPAPAGNSGGPFRTVDAGIKELSAEAGDRFSACIAALDFLRGDLAATKRRLKARNGGKIPSSQSGLVAVKIKRVGRQQQSCIDQTKQTNDHFTLVMRSLASVEPNNHPGIPARREKIAALREKFTATLKKLKVEGKSAQSADSNDAGDGGDGAQPAEDGSAQ
jgi:hypothetical protein